MSQELLYNLAIFTLAILVGFEVICEGPGDAPHAAHVGRELDPRDRPRRRDAHRRRGRLAALATSWRSSRSSSAR